MTTDAIRALMDPDLSREDRVLQVLTMLQTEQGDVEGGADELTDDEAWAELEELRHRNASLARALGACADCWGEHDGCPMCGGAGHAGWRLPDPTGFNVLVVPAASRVQRERSRATAPRSTRG